MKKMSLREMLRKEQENRVEGGMFGIAECKQSIEFRRKISGKTLEELLDEYYERACTDIYFNRAMLLACYEMICEELRSAE